MLLCVVNSSKQAIIIIDNFIQGRWSSLINILLQILSFTNFNFSQMANKSISQTVLRIKDELSEILQQKPRDVIFNLQFEVSDQDVQFYMQ